MNTLAALFLTNDQYRSGCVKNHQACARVTVGVCSRTPSRFIRRYLASILSHKRETIYQWKLYYYYYHYFMATSLYAFFCASFILINKRQIDCCLTLFKWSSSWYFMNQAWQRAASLRSRTVFHTHRQLCPLRRIASSCFVRCIIPLKYIRYLYHIIDAYQETMMKCLRDVNVDHHQVGWYQVCLCFTTTTLDFN